MPCKERLCVVFDDGAGTAPKRPRPPCVPSVAAIMVVLSVIIASRAEVADITNCSDHGQYLIVSHSSYRLINCTADNVTFYTEPTASELLNVVVAVEGGRTFPTFNLHAVEQPGVYSVGRVLNVTIQFIDVIANVPAPILFRASVLTDIFVSMRRVQLDVATGWLVRFRSDGGQSLKVSVVDSRIHSAYAGADTPSVHLCLFEFSAYDGEYLSAEILRSVFVLRAEGRVSMVGFINHQNHAQLHLADLNVSFLFVQSPSVDFFASVAHLYPHAASRNVSCLMRRISVAVALGEGVVVRQKMDSYLLYAAASMERVSVVIESVVMQVHGGAVGALILMEDVNSTRDVSVAMRSCAAFFLLDDQLGSAESTTSARAASVLRISVGSSIAYATIAIHNTTLGAQLLKPRNGVLGSYGAARASLVFVTSINAVWGMAVVVSNVTITTVVDDQSRGFSVGGGFFGTRVFEASASFVLVQLCDVEASSFAVHDAVLNANVTVGAPPAFPSTVTSLVNAWSGVVGGVFVANATNCTATIANTKIRVQHMGVYGSSTSAGGGGATGIGNVDCSQPLVMKLAALVLTMDTVEHTVRCLAPIVTLLPPGSVPAPLRHANFNVTITNATIQMHNGTAAVYNPPSSTAGVRILAEHVAVARPQDMATKEQPSSIIYVYTTAIHGLDVAVRDVHGWQALLHREVLLGATLDEMRISVDNSNFVASPMSPWVLSLPSASLANAELRVGGSSFDGFDALVGWPNGTTVPPSWSAARPFSHLQLLCNTWNGDPTTRRFYNKHVLANLHPMPTGLVANTTAACYEAPTQTVPIVPPASTRVLRVSDAAVSVSTIAIAVSGLASVMLPGVASGLSAVRLQTSMRVLRNRQRCSTTPDAVVGGNGDEDDEDAYGAYAIDNPVLVALTGLGPKRAYAGGAVVGNTALVLLLAVATSAIPRLWARGASSLSACSFPEGGCRAWLRRLLERLPGSGVVPFAILLQPLAGCSVLLVVMDGPDRVGGAVLGVMGLCFAVGALILVSVRILHGRFPLVARPVFPSHRRRSAARRKKERESGAADASAAAAEHSSLRCGSSSLATAMRTLVDPRWEWRAPSHRAPEAGSVDRAAQRRRCRLLLERYGPVFDAYRGGLFWYFTVDLYTTVVLGLLDALPAASLDLCDAALYGVLAIVLLLLIAACITRPCAAPLDNALAIAGAALTAATTVVVFASSGEATDNAVEVLVLLQSALTVVGQVGALAGAVMRAARDGLAWWLSAAPPPPTQNLFSQDSLALSPSCRRRQPTTCLTRGASLSHGPPPPPVAPITTQAQNETLLALLEMVCDRTT